MLLWRQEMTPPSDWPPNPFATPAPKKVRPEEDDLWPEKEVSKVDNNQSAYEKLEKIDRALLRMVDPIMQIPDIKEKVEHIGERVTRVEEQIKSTKEDVGKLDSFVGRPHDCFQVDNIERVEVAALSLRKDIEDETRKIGLMSKDVTKLVEGKKTAKELRRSAYYFWVAVVIGFLSTAGGALWYMRGVSADIQIETQTRDFQFKQIEAVLNKVSVQTNPEPMAAKMVKLQDAVDRNGSAKMTEWCAKLSSEDIRRLKTILPQESWPTCATP